MDSIEYLVIGAGVIGLACAMELSKISNEVVVIDTNDSIGQETSSRNSEVIHAGIYYNKDSLKARFCASGKNKLYNYCDLHKVSYNKIGKLIVAQSEVELDTIRQLIEQAKNCGVNDLKLLTPNEIARIEPNIKAYKALLSPSTGIIDSHGFMLSLQGQIEDRGGMMAVQSKLLKATVKGDFVEAVLQSGQEVMTLNVRNIINSAGLFASNVSNSISGFDNINLPTHYYKGSYFSIPGKSPFNHLIYPVPEPGGLGIHSVNDMSGKVRFGPDVEYTESLDYSINGSKVEKFVDAISKYWPDVMLTQLQADFVGIRPKTIKIEDGGNDFNIQYIKKGKTSLTNLFGIESPGLTASLAIGEYVKDRILGGK